jgi:hypothetical protein
MAKRMPATAAARGVVRDLLFKILSGSLMASL